jgi:hypothetical protein
MVFHKRWVCGPQEDILEKDLTLYMFKDILKIKLVLISSSMGLKKKIKKVKFYQVKLKILK